MELYKSETILAAEMTQKEFGKLIGVTQSRISQLCDEGIIIKNELSGKIRVIESLRNYYLSKNAPEDGVSYWTERSKHEKAKRELAELKLRERRGELYEAAEVEGVLCEYFADFRNKLLVIGHKLSRRLEGQSARVICEAIDEEITHCLEELSANVEDGKAEFVNSAEA